MQHLNGLFCALHRPYTAKKIRLTDQRDPYRSSKPTATFRRRRITCGQPERHAGVVTIDI
jgi:hypothetical protein